MQTDDGRLYVISGASRSGKSVWTYRKVKAAKRVAVWDPEDQWAKLPGFKKITSKADLFHACKHPGAAKLAYVAGGDLREEFNFFSGCAMHWGMFYGPCAVVAEELADVSTPAKAPGDWGKLVRRGLKRGIDIYAISQRWAEADKTAFGNASEIICFRASSDDDIAYIARKTRIPADKLDKLRSLEFVAYDTDTKVCTPGKIRF